MSQYTYDYNKPNNSYTTLGGLGQYKCVVNSCLAPNAFNEDTRSKRDLDDFKRYVTDKQESYCPPCRCRRNCYYHNLKERQEEVSNQENYCSCAGNCQLFNRDLKNVEDLYVNGKVTEYSF